MDQIRAVEAEADEILREAGVQARAILGEAEEQSRNVSAQSQRKASEQAREMARAARIRMDQAEADTNKVIAAHVAEVNDTAKANWNRASELAVRKVLTRFGDL